MSVARDMDIENSLVLGGKLKHAPPNGGPGGACFSLPVSQ